MQKSALIGIAVVIILAIVAVWYFSMQSSMSSTDTGANAATSESTSGTSGTGTTGSSGSTGSSGTAGSGNTFRSIFTQSGNNECKYEQVTATGKGASVVHIADGKMHAEFRSTSNGVTTANLMVYTGGSLYVWQEGKTTGTKTSIRTIADLPEAIPSNLDSGAILGTSANNVSWDCHPWNKDSKVFTIPTYVKFTAK